jgi:hypothetical protein
MFAAVRSGRRWAKTYGRTLESPGMVWESGRVGQLASKSQLVRGKVGPDLHVGSAAWAAPNS